MPEEHVKGSAKAGDMSARLLCIVVKGGKQRFYLSPISEHERAGLEADAPEDLSSVQVGIPYEPRALWCLGYGLDTFDKLFTDRQLTLLTDLADSISGVRDKVLADASGHPKPEEYATAVATYLAFAVDRMADRHSALTSWDPNPSGYSPKIRNTFARQGLPMVWDYTEGNPFSDSTGNLDDAVGWIVKVLKALQDGTVGIVDQADAASTMASNPSIVISTDPPYYDNIGYSDLSDFFYVWLRRSLGNLHDDLFGTLLTPKADELIAAPYRLEGNEKKAYEFFEDRMLEAFSKMHDVHSSSIPLTLFYAFKQIESKKSAGDAIQSTGWETMLSALIESEFMICGTWPMRTESTAGLKGKVNALASSIVLVCRPRPENTQLVTRRDFANALRKELPEAIKHLQSGNVAPVDLAQASIGPGMAVFSRYSKVVNADGSPMSVREALQLINQVLDESLIEQESDFDSETRFAIRWFEQYGMQEGPFGDAETLAKAMAVAVSGVVEAGILHSRAGKVRLLGTAEMDPNWDPKADNRLTIWEVTQHLIRTLEKDGEGAAGELLQRIGAANGEIARELAYRLYQNCERKKMADDARSYNGLVVSWPEIVKLSRQITRQEAQTGLF